MSQSINLPIFCDLKIINNRTFYVYYLDQLVCIVQYDQITKDLAEWLHYFTTGKYSTIDRSLNHDVIRTINKGKLILLKQMSDQWSAINDF